MTRTAALEVYGSEKPKRSNPEFELQRAIVSYLEVAAVRDVIWEGVNSGGFKLGRAAAGRQKAMGIRKGSPDLHFVLNDGKAAFMELKAPGGALSTAQIEFRAQCINLGVPYVVASNFDVAVEVLKAWGVVR